MRYESQSLTSELILLVEDNLDHAVLIRRMFEANKLPYRICHLSDGEIALDYLFRKHDYADPATSPRPSLVLLDLRLPKLGGLEVLKAVKTSEELWGIPVVILTTSDVESDISQAYEHHANNYLVKPVDFEKFEQVLEELALTG